MKYSVKIVGLVFALVDDKLCLMILNGQDSKLSSLPQASLNHDELPEETLKTMLAQFNVDVDYIEQLYTFIDSQEHDDRSITMAYLVLCTPQNSSVIHADDSELKWTSTKRVTGLSEFQQIIKEKALERLRNKVAYSRIATRLLPSEFTLAELKNVYDQILGEELDKRNFQKKVESKKLVTPTLNYRRGAHRPARLYKRGPKAKNVEL